MNPPIARDETVRWTDYAGKTHLDCRVLEHSPDAGLYHLQTPDGPQWAIADEVERANPEARREA
jgi:hypothetical protein